MTDEKTEDGPPKHDYESKECKCPTCEALRTMGYTPESWIEDALTPINTFLTDHLKKHCDIINKKQVDGAITPDQATLLKDALYSNARHQMMHLTAHLSHSDGQRIGEFVGEAAEHWNVARPRPTMGLIPIPISKELMERIGARVQDPFGVGDVGKKKDEPEQPN